MFQGCWYVSLPVWCRIGTFFLQRGGSRCLVCSNYWACSSNFSHFLESVSAEVVLCLSLLWHFQSSASESHKHWIMLHDHHICSNAFVVVCLGLHHILQVGCYKTLKETAPSHPDLRLKCADVVMVGCWLLSCLQCL
jgi:hypothetical protein